MVMLKVCLRSSLALTSEGLSSDRRGHGLVARDRAGRNRPEGAKRRKRAHAAFGIEAMSMTPTDRPALFICAAASSAGWTVIPQAMMFSSSPR